MMSPWYGSRWLFAVEEVAIAVIGHRGCNRKGVGDDGRHGMGRGVVCRGRDAIAVVGHLGLSRKGVGGGRRAVAVIGHRVIAKVLVLMSPWYGSRWLFAVEELRSR